MQEVTVSWEISVDGKGDVLVMEQRLAQMAALDLEVGTERILDALENVKTNTAAASRLQWMSKYAHNKDQRYMVAVASKGPHQSICVARCNPFLQFQA